MTSSDNRTWTGTFTPTDNTQLSNQRLRLNTSYNDIKGNPGIAKNSSYYVVDTRAPSVESLQFTRGSTVLTLPFTDRCLPVTGNIIVTFSEAMFTTSITADESPPGCGASIQVSSDNFSSCVVMPEDPVASDSNKTFTLDPVDNLSYDTTYIISVKTGVNDVYIEDALGNNRSEQDNSSFYTSSSLLLSFRIIHGSWFWWKDP